MEPENLTVQILREIRDEVKKTNERLDQSNERIDGLGQRIDETNKRVDETNERLVDLRKELSQRIVESEIRTATAITDLAGAVHSLRDAFVENLNLSGRVSQCEHDIKDIKRKLPT